MPFCVRNSNQPQPTAPESFQELVDFINYLTGLKEEFFVQISGYKQELVKSISDHFHTNYFDWEETNINPFTVIYITQSGEVRSDQIDRKSKVIIYAQRPINHY
jgi:hypothetical protein